MKYKIISLLLILAYLPIYAKWVWSPQEGWINTRYQTKDTAKKLLSNGKKFKKNKQINEARESLKTAWRYYPNSSEGKEAVLLLADIEIENKEEYQAYLYYQEFLTKYPSASNLQNILEKEYEIGSNIIRKKTKENPISGVEILENVIATSPYSDFADDSQMTIANYYYKEKLYLEAQLAYNDVIKKYSKSEWVPAAKYQSALCSYKTFRSIKHDSRPLKDAKKSLDRYVKNNPDRSNIKIAQKTQKEIIEKLASKDISVGEFYIQQGKAHSARIYLVYVLRKYPKTRAAQKAKFLLQKINKK